MNPLILVVDDNSMFRKSLLDWLEVFYPQCRFMGASSGEECLEVAQETEPDVVVMDVRLPGLSGIEATREMRRLGLKSQVIVMTTMDTECYRQDAMNAGAAAFVVKDRSWLELPGVLERLLEDALPVSRRGI